MFNFILRSLAISFFTLSLSGLVQADERVADDTTFCSESNSIFSDVTESTLNFIFKFSRQCLTKGNSKLYINSTGGDADTGAAVYDRLRENGSRLTTVIYGKAWSAASLIFMAGDVRQMSCHSYIRIHQVVITMPSGPSVVYTADKLSEYADSVDFSSSIFINIYAERTGLDKKTVSEMVYKGKILSAKEALRLNFATEIIGDCDE